VKVRVLFFAYLRERCGGRETTLDVPEGTTVGEVWKALCARYEGLDAERIRVAVNAAYVDNAVLLHDNDELALIPPVSGGAGVESRSTYRVTEETIDASGLLRVVGDPGAGAAVLFVGSTRDENEGRTVERLEYEAYGEMARAEMARLGAEIARRWPVRAIAMVHRVGLVPVGEASVAVAVSAPHREEAFAACQYGIDQLKATVPIWKKEHYRGGTVWIGACHGHAAAERHEDRG
jgi:molybdopterin synthase catalytic subunit